MSAGDPSADAAGPPTLTVRPGVYHALRLPADDVTVTSVAHRTAGPP
ncbi:hypothetical protein ACFZCU_44710 [Streptomyces canus]